MPFRLDDHPQTYGGHEQHNEFTQNTGLVVCPLARRTPGHRVIRLHGGYGMRRVKWSSARRGQPPLIPQAADLNGDTLLSATVVAELPRPNPAARGYDWSAYGEYVFVQDDMRVAGTDALPVGDYPFLVEAATYTSQQYGAGAYTVWSTSAKDKAAYNSLISTLFGAVTADNDGNLIWPYMAIAPQFSSNHLFGG